MRQVLAHYDAHGSSVLVNEVSWALGYLSSTNMTRGYNEKPPPRYVDSETITACMTKYCRDKPLNYLYQAVTALTVELFK